MKRTNIICTKCTREISKSNFNKHYDRCDGTFFTGANRPKKNKKTAEELKEIKKKNITKAREALIGKPNPRKGLLEYSDEEIFKEGSSGPVKKYFLTKVDYCCFKCKIVEWNDIPITLELDHINGNNTDNRIENLRLLCPNCHSQTSTYKNKNKSGIKKISDEMLISALATTNSKRQALLKVGLQAQGANYSRLDKIIEKYKLSNNDTD
jgi:5-methylcytosine-specific restriction endonuclease McrA